MPGTKEYELHKDTVDQWYLNPTLFKTYKPLFQLVRNLIYDPNIVNIYSFDDKLIKKMIKIKVWFKAESII